jgi:hypothetical protein
MKITATEFIKVSQSGLLQFKISATEILLIEPTDYLEGMEVNDDNMKKSTNPLNGISYHRFQPKLSPELLVRAGKLREAIVIGKAIQGNNQTISTTPSISEDF